jgi:hypothetical protein
MFLSPLGHLQIGAGLEVPSGSSSMPLALEVKRPLAKRSAMSDVSLPEVDSY